jgi:DNA modification methylase
MISDTIEHRSTDAIRPNKSNPRVHPKWQIEKLRESIREFGFTIPILCDTSGTIIAGHGRLEAAKAEGLLTVPVIVADNWTEDQCLAYMIADNALTDASEWDRDLLSSIAVGLSDRDFDVDLLGFSSNVLDRVLNFGQDDDDDIDEASQQLVVSSQGDVWILGDHRLLCGDSTKESDVARALNGASPHLMVTDPPYGVSYDPDRRNVKAAYSFKGHTGGGRAVGTVEGDDNADWTEAWKLFHGDVVYCWHGALTALEVARSIVDAGFELRSQIIWAKNNHVLALGDYHWQHESLIYAAREGRPRHWQGDRTQTTVWDIKKNEKNETGHGTQKPVECMKRPMINSSQPGDYVYDPFCGSGTTIIAAESAGRKAICIEINPAYVDVAVRRWQTLTGDTAINETSGLTYSEHLAVREAERDARDNASTQHNPV